MNMLYTPHAGSDTALRHHDALKRLGWMERAVVPSFHTCGIINADIGYYQLARLPDGTRLLVFALNLEDLQLKEYAGCGAVFAHPERLYGVNAFDDSASPAKIYQSLVDHQIGLQHVMLEEYTLVRTDEHLYQSYSVSYATADAPETEEPNDVHLFSTIDALHNKELARIDLADASLYATVRYPRLCLTSGKPVHIRDAVAHILENFTAMLTLLMQGKEGIQLENAPLTARNRLALRTKIHMLHMADKVGKTLGKTKEELKDRKVSTSVEWVNRLVAVAKVLSGAEKFELLLALWEVFNVAPADKPHPNAPKALHPHIRGLGLYTRLNAYLHPLRVEKIEMAKPLTMEEAQINPGNVRIRTNNPFTPTLDHPPSIGSIRAPMGMVLIA
ncbi:MAG: hypothetical protein KGI97_07510, partial [Alphaproteobacteria bacterium]|nr:hypothetical protein [Alphaproteobacteria bacterium]